MRAERWLLRAGEYLLSLACNRLPPDIREEQYREWAAELPAILHDPQIRLAPWRAVRMLGFAADTVRGTAVAAGRARGWMPRLSAAWALLVLGGCLVSVALGTWLIVQAPGSAQGYLVLAWAVPFSAFFIRKRVRPAGRMTALLAISGIPGLVAWNVTQGPGDWVNYLLAALLGLLLLVLLLLACWFLVLFLLTWWHRIRRPAQGGYDPRHSK
jgi:hypothetical protein